MHTQPAAPRTSSNSTLTTTLPSPATTCNFPELPYTPHTRKRSIAIAYSALILITCIQVEFFFLLRRFATSASLDTALTVPTALLLGFSTPAMLLRTWQLARRGSNVNPVSRRQYFFDYFNWNTIIGFIILTAVLSPATAKIPQNTRQAAMPLMGEVVRSLERRS